MCNSSRLEGSTERREDFKTGGWYRKGGRNGVFVGGCPSRIVRVSELASEGQARGTLTPPTPPRLKKAIKGATEVHRSRRGKSLAAPAQSACKRARLPVGDACSWLQFRPTCRKTHFAGGRVNSINMRTKGGGRKNKAIVAIAVRFQNTAKAPDADHSPPPQPRNPAWVPHARPVCSLSAGQARGPACMRCIVEKGPGADSWVCLPGSAL